MVVSIPGDGIADDGEDDRPGFAGDGPGDRVGGKLALGFTLFCRRRRDTLWGKAEANCLLSVGSGDATVRDRSTNNPRVR